MKSKWKSVTLLSILCVILAFLLTMSFIRFPVGVKDYNSVLGAIEFDYDLNGGVAYTYKLASSSEVVEDVDAVMDTMGARLSALGYKDYTIKALKEANVENAEYKIRIETRATESIDSDMQTVTAYGTVKFYGGTTSDPTTEIMNEQNSVEDARYVGMSEQGNSKYYQVALKFTDYGYNALKEEIGKVSDGESYYLKIMLGETVIMQPATISLEGISDKTVYPSTGSETSAKQMALQLKTGGLAYEYELDGEAEVITPMLGENALLCAQIIAGAIMVLAIIAMFIMYRGYGIISLLTMVFYVVLELSMMIAVPGIVLSVYGVIGIIISALLTVFGLALTAGKIKNEFANGRTLKAAMRAGYKRSFIPVLNACVIAGVIGLVAFFFTGGAIQSFGISLGIGAVVAFLGVVVISRMFAEIMLPLIKNPQAFYNVKEVE